MIEKQHYNAPAVCVIEVSADDVIETSPFLGLFQKRLNFLWKNEWTGMESTTGWEVIGQ